MICDKIIKLVHKMTVKKKIQKEKKFKKLKTGKRNESETNIIDIISHVIHV